MERRERPVTSADSRQVFLGPHHEAADGDPLGALHDLDKKPVGADRAIRLAGGNEKVGVVEVDRIDGGELGE